MKEMLNDYLDKKTDAITVIRKLSGMFNPDYAIDILSIICTITRHEQGDIETETFREIYKLKDEVING
jgi:hypothetical protein